MGYTLVTNDSNNSLFGPQLPIGIGLNFQNTALFQTLLSNPDQLVNNLKNLLLTKIGERYGVPTYGSDLLYILFEPNLNDLKDNIKDLIRTPINKWLPQINVIDIVITTAEDNPDLQHEIEIKIIFSTDDNFLQSLDITGLSTGAVSATSTVVI
jgi:phage baseplate assembly protein W